MPIQQEHEAQALAREVLDFARSTLLTQLRFLAPALCSLPLEPGTEEFATDGAVIYYDFLHVLRLYKLQPELVSRALLHLVLHCVFHHPFVGDQVDPDAWDLACDCAVEAVLDELALPGCQLVRQPELDGLLARLRGALPQLSAERIYRYLLDQRLEQEVLRRLRERFAPDSHSMWYRPQGAEKEKTGEDGDSDESDGDDGQQSGSGGEQEPEDAEQPGGTGEQESAGEDTAMVADPDALQAQWEHISQQIQTDLETVSRTRGDEAAALLRNLRECNRERQDYSAFLRRFAVLGEQMRLSPDEFDYVYYTFGLSRYGNLPLLEPLEYQEAFRIRDFVIAIDTSASVDGDTVARFVEKTFEILEQSGSFFEKICLHLIQCDAKIQEDRVITCREELEAYQSTMQLHGFGGTDFRPVFAYVDGLVAQQRLPNLRGLIYFTDGDGTFPARPPAYPVVFVLPDDLEEHPVPPWAMRVLLDAGQLGQSQRRTP